MKATELISKLEALIAVHGDLPVTCEDGMDPSTRDHITDVEVRGPNGWELDVPHFEVSS